MRRTSLLLAACALGAAACDPAPTSPAPEAQVRAKVWSGEQDRVVTVMTRNIYLGAAFDRIIAERNPMLVPLRVAETWAIVNQSNFPARAGRLAAEIVAADPELVGLQEVALWRTQTPGDQLGQNPTQATTVTFDFLQLLLDSLAARGALYDVEATSTNTDIEMPAMVTPPPNFAYIDVRFTDRDVILARRDVRTTNPQSGLYDAAVTYRLAGGTTLEGPRGWTSVDVQFGRTAFRFFNTHLEVQGFEEIQEAQAQEAIDLLLASPYPVIAVGDFNSAADGSTTDSYEMFTSAHFKDVWNPRSTFGQPGLTCCHDELLREPTPTLTSRIDLVLTLGLPGAARAYVIEGARTPGGLWPSDHLGVVATVKLK